MPNSELRLFRALFVVAALWNLTGAMFGYFNTAYTFEGLFGKELTDPLMYIIYKGSWGTTFVYFFGYLIVARNPLKHMGIVMVGGIGKAGYIVTVTKLYLDGLANSYIFIIVVGDTLFVLFFLYYFYRLHKSGVALI